MISKEAWAGADAAKVRIAEQRQSHDADMQSQIHTVLL